MSDESIVQDEWDITAHNNFGVSWTVNRLWKEIVLRLQIPAELCVLSGQEKSSQMSPFHKHMPCCVDLAAEAVCQSYLQKRIVGVQPIMNVKIILSFPLGESKGSGQKTGIITFLVCFSLIVLQTERGIFRRIFACAER